MFFLGFFLISQVDLLFASSLLKEGKIEEALYFYQVWEEVLSPDGEGYKEVLERLAEIYYKKQEYLKALRYYFRLSTKEAYKKALSLVEEVGLEKEKKEILEKIQQKAQEDPSWEELLSSSNQTSSK